MFFAWWNYREKPRKNNLITIYYWFLFASFLDEIFDSVDEIFVKIATYLNFAILENESSTESKSNPPKEELLVLLVTKVRKKKETLDSCTPRALPSGRLRRNDRNEEQWIHYAFRLPFISSKNPSLVSPLAARSKCRRYFAITGSLLQ